MILLFWTNLIEEIRKLSLGRIKLASLKVFKLLSVKSFLNLKLRKEKGRKLKLGFMPMVKYKNIVLNSKETLGFAEISAWNFLIFC